jgi:predicted GNAT superfamily acetyltransferase
MQWTFDPLQTRNAYFNLTKLGGISRRYISNLYGITSSPLHGGLPTDRLLIEWELTSERVRRTIAGEAPQRGAETLEIPLPTDPERKTIAGQAALRNRLTNAFAEGFILTGLRSEGSSHTYLLERN